MKPRFWIQIILWPLALIGLISLILAFMLETPLKEPKMLESVNEGAKAISQEQKPELSFFQARDGTWLAYRLYPAMQEKSDQLAILVHGSSGSSSQMNTLAKSLTERGVTSVAIDVRGHGASGTRGDICYIGQLDDDHADLLMELAKTYPQQKRTLIGHSSGGGFALRIAASPLREKFYRFILLSPYLGYSAPTNRTEESSSKWVEVDLPRMLAINVFSLIGINCPESLATIAFANPPNSQKSATSHYTYRLMINFGPPDDWKEAFQKAPDNIEVIAGIKDELMNGPAYKQALEPLGVKVELLDDVDHMGVVYMPQALEAIRNSIH